MNSQVLIGRKVAHKSLGAGIIVDANGVYVAIDFNGTSSSQREYR